MQEIGILTGRHRMISEIQPRLGGRVTQMNESTGEFVAKTKDTQEKDKKNREHYGKGTPSSKLPTKQHSNNP